MLFERSGTRRMQTCVIRLFERKPPDLSIFFLNDLYHEWAPAHSAPLPRGRRVPPRGRPQPRPPKRVVATGRASERAAAGAALAIIMGPQWVWALRANPWKKYKKNFEGKPFRTDAHLESAQCPPLRRASPAWPPVRRPLASASRLPLLRARCRVVAGFSRHFPVRPGGRRRVRGFCTAAPSSSADLNCKEGSAALWRARMGRPGGTD